MATGKLATGKLVTSKLVTGKLLTDKTLVEKDAVLPWWEKYTLTVEEASKYFGIGEKSLRRFIKEHRNENFIMYNGAKAQIKRKLFEQYIDEKLSIL